MARRARLGTRLNALYVPDYLCRWFAGNNPVSDDAMIEQQSSPEYLALLAEEMSQEELRILLKRLGEQEFGEPNPTIGAVVEATGADALTVSKMLRAIRNENLDEKIEKALGPRDQKIENLQARTHRVEQKVESMSKQPPQTTASTKKLSLSDRRRREYIDEMIDKEERERISTFIILAFVVPLVLLLWAAASCRS
ncbi:MAG: hypothetical protein KF784_12210 [Fimbriimonadaceae bacterium]|nr:hypothetical protein [Fimbriimonadaceae bacterium]